MWGVHAWVRVASVYLISQFCVHFLAIESMLEYPIGMERFFGWDAKLKKVTLSHAHTHTQIVLSCHYRER